MLHLLTAAAKTKFGYAGVLRHAPASGFFRRLAGKKKVRPVLGSGEGGLDGGSGMQGDWPPPRSPATLSR
jgi:hypothetical protein